MTRLAAERGKALDLTPWADCSDQDYERMEPFQWGSAHPLADRFPTASGKARIVPVEAPIASPQEPGTLVLNTGRYRDQWHTMTRTGLSPTLSLHRREPQLEVAPADATALGLADGGFARVASPRGDTIYRVAVSEGQAAGQVFAPMHFTDANSGGGRTGRLVAMRTDPVSGQPAFKNVPVRVEAFAPDWRAFLLTRERVVPQCRYWAQARVRGGWLTELAGTGSVDAEALLPDGARREVADIKRGMLRVMVSDEEGALQAALFVTRTGRLPARDWVEKQFTADGDAGEDLLAGRPSTPMPDRGPIVCVCHDIGEQQVLAAADAGAASVAEVGKATCAGTNCGSCRPLIAQLLEEARHAAKEAAQ